MTDDEHLLTCLAEELAEVVEQCARIQVRIAKTLRFGPGEVQPGQDRTNAARLAIELAEVRELAALLDEAGLVPADAGARKRGKLANFIAYSRRLGVLPPAPADPPPVAADPADAAPADVIVYTLSIWSDTAAGRCYVDPRGDPTDDLAAALLCRTPDAVRAWALRGANPAYVAALAAQFPHVCPVRLTATDVGERDLDLD